MSSRFDTLAEAEILAKRRLPRVMFQRLQGGAGTGQTVTANRAAFTQLQFRARGAAAAATRSTSTTIAGMPVSAPVVLAPVGALRLQHPHGVLAALEAAAGFGTICAVSPGAGHQLGEINLPPASSAWYQITTAIGGQEVAEQHLDEAARRGFCGIVLTVDSVLRPKAEPIRLNLRTVVNFAPDLLRHPRWTFGFLRDGMRLSVANAALGATATGPARPIDWDDLNWIRDRWPGPVIVKGVLTSEDARRAADAGADVVVVSNHGGLTLDGARASLHALPEVLRAVGSEVEVLVDGGVRDGNDVARALALGARGVLIGRAYVMALAAGGAEGVRRILDLFQEDLDRALAFLGCVSVNDLDESHVVG